MESARVHRHTCRGGDEYVGTTRTLAECATEISAQGGKYFVYGHRGAKKGQCFRQFTTNASPVV